MIVDRCENLYLKTKYFLLNNLYLVDNTMNVDIKPENLAFT